MTREEIISTINDFLVEEFEVERGKILPEANLKETLELDSLDYVDMVVVIENNFGFKVNAEDFKSIASFQDFYNYIEARVNQTAVEN
jgi:acyl carrier protein